MKNLVERTILDFKNKKIAVIGDIILDRTERGIISKRKNPENGKVPIILGREEFYLGGCGNVARNLSSLGANVDLYGIIGKDLYGHQIKKMCAENTINTNYLIEDEKPTILKARTFIENDYKHRLDLGEINKNYKNNLGNLSKENQNKILANLEKEIINYKGIFLSDYNKRMFSKDFTQKIINLANNLKIPIICDAKPENIDYFKFCTVVCPNNKEAERMSKENNLLKMGEKIQNRISSKYIVITCGKDGAFVYDKRKSKMIKTKAKKVVEVTGAGDTFSAVLGMGIISGLDVFESAKLANFASGMVVEKAGTSVITRKELINYLRKGL